MFGDIMKVLHTRLIIHEQTITGLCQQLQLSSI